MCLSDGVCFALTDMQSKLPLCYLSHAAGPVPDRAMTGSLRPSDSEQGGLPSEMLKRRGACVSFH